MLATITLDAGYQGGRYTTNPTEMHPPSRNDARWVEIPTIRGHLGGVAPPPGSPEDAFIAAQVRPFLAELH